MKVALRRSGPPEERVALTRSQPLDWYVYVDQLLGCHAQLEDPPAPVAPRTSDQCRRLEGGGARGERRDEVVVALPERLHALVLDVLGYLVHVHAHRSEALPCCVGGHDCVDCIDRA